MANNTFANTISSWALPSNILFGRGACEELPERLAQFDAKNPIVVTDPGVAKADIFQGFLGILKTNNIKHNVSSEVVPEPPVSCLAVHALAYPLGGRYHVPHGQANAVLLAATMRFNAPCCQEEFKRLGLAMGIENPTAEGLVSELEELTKQLGIPSSISSLEVKESEIPDMAKDAVAIERLMAPNPREVTLSDAEDIYASVF